jgi:hypothetical protein
MIYQTYHNEDPNHPHGEYQLSFSPFFYFPPFLKDDGKKQTGGVDPLYDLRNNLRLKAPKSKTCKHEKLE